MVMAMLSKSGYQDMKYLSFLLQWLFATLLLLLAFNLKAPHLLKVRAWEVPVLLSIGLLWSSVLIWHIRQSKRSLHKKMLLFALITMMLATINSELTACYQKYQVQQAEPERLAKLGRHLLLGYRSLDEVKSLIASGAISGVYISRRNINGKTAAQIQAEIQNLQDIRKAAGFQTPLLIATDQEGGLVSRLSPPLTRLPSIASIIAKQKPEQWEKTVHDYAQIQGQGLAQLGINLNFAPVVDLNIELGDIPLDFHSKISRRAIAENPAVVTKIAEIYVQTLEQQGILATLKHFPGLGRVTSDTHHFPAYLNTDLTLLKQRDWLPFRQVASNTQAFIMVGHVTLSALDQQEPASRSSKVIQTVVRKDWQHQGVLITDDLSMGAFYYSWQGIGKSAIDALQASMDILLIAYDTEKFYPVMYALLQAEARGELDEHLLKQSANRIKHALTHWDTNVQQ